MGGRFPAALQDPQASAAVEQGVLDQIQKNAPKGFFLSKDKEIFALEGDFGSESCLFKLGLEAQQALSQQRERLYPLPVFRGEGEVLTGQLGV